MATSIITEEVETICISQTEKSLNIKLHVKLEETEEPGADSNADHGASVCMLQAAEKSETKVTMEERSEPHADLQKNSGHPNPRTKTGRNKNMCLRASKSVQSIEGETNEPAHKSQSCSDMNMLSKGEDKPIAIQKQYSTPDTDGPYTLNDTMSNLQLQESEEAFVCSDPPSPPSLAYSMTSLTARTSSSSSPVDHGDIGGASQVAEPPETGGKKDIMIIHSDTTEDSDSAQELKCHLCDCLRPFHPSIEIFGDYGIGQSYFESLEQISDSFRLILVYSNTETWGDDILTKRSVGMLQMDGLKNRSTPNNVWHKLIPVLSRRKSKLPFALNDLKPLNYWIHIQRNNNLRQSYVESLENLLKRARRDDP